MPDRIYADVSPLSLLLGPTIVYVATLMAALYPALRLHWLRPVDAMRAV
jgi:ABC-type lipoprotein release transport system permease subunit